MGNDKPDYKGCDINTVLRHERELGEMASITRQLAEQNTDIANTLKEFNRTVTDLSVIISKQQEHISNVENIGKEIGNLNNSIFKLETTINDLKEDISERDQRISSLESSTSHIKWLNTGVKTVTDKAGYMFVLAILGLLVTNGSGFMRVLKTLSIQIGL